MSQIVRYYELRLKENGQRLINEFVMNEPAFILVHKYIDVYINVFSLMARQVMYVLVCMYDDTRTFGITTSPVLLNWGGGGGGSNGLLLVPLYLEDIYLIYAK